MLMMRLSQGQLAYRCFATKAASTGARGSGSRAGMTDAGCAESILGSDEAAVRRETREIGRCI